MLNGPKISVMQDENVWDLYNILLTVNNTVLYTYKFVEGRFNFMLFSTIIKKEKKKTPLHFCPVDWGALDVI